MQELLREGNDPEVKKCLTRRLPDLLDEYVKRKDGKPDFAWGSEARLAGELRIVEAAPVLARRIDMVASFMSGGAQGYNFSERGADDALLKIGAPAVPFVIEVLKHGTIRRREI